MVWKPFPYPPLNGTQIRCITVHPPNGSASRLQCTLHQAPLEHLDFNALSYAWGDPSVTETIILSGKPFRATANLVACLRQLATRAKKMNLWVDAICINQIDIIERNVQVQRMKDIYSAAQCVITWLGPSTNLSRIGCQRIQNINDKEAMLLRGSGKEQDMKQKTRILDRVLNGEGEHGLRDLLLREYWHRTWIIQEFTLGRKISLICGGDEIRLEKLYALTLLLIDSMIMDNEQTVAAAKPQDLPHFRWCLWVKRFFADVQDGALRVIMSIEYQTRPLQTLLSNFRAFQCSDNRDRIYALLGIADDVEEISPNYNDSTAQVYGEVVHWLIKKHSNLDILSMAFYHNQRDPSFASWIPDWRSGAPDPQGFVDGSRRRGEYSASKGLSVLSHCWSLNNTAGRLHLAGACLDTITSLSTPGPAKYRNSAENLVPVLEWLQMVHERLGKGSFDTTRKLGLDGGRYLLNDDEPLAEACRRTLVADCDTVGTSEARSPFMMLFPWDKSQRRSDGSAYDHNFTDEFYVLLLKYRRLAITSKGWIGLVQKEAEVGDHVAILIGASVPFILRKAQGVTASSLENEYILIGDAYIHGLMHGRGLDLAEMGEIILR